jgi:hypothetical protein
MPRLPRRKLLAKKDMVSGPFPAYDTKPGELTPPLDPADPLVQINIYAGIISDPNGDGSPDTMTCPLCVEAGEKKPPRLDIVALSSHYAENHAGFAVPAFNPDSEEE